MCDPCHVLCLTCYGTTENECLTCDDIKNRVKHNTGDYCGCKDLYYENIDTNNNSECLEIPCGEEKAGKKGPDCAVEIIISE